MKTLVRTLIICMVACCGLRGVAAERADSVSCFDRTASTPAFKITHVGLPVIVGGLAVYGANGSMKDGAVGNFARHYDTQYEDYLQYAPGVALLALKVGGMEGRSSWPRMIVSDAFSAVLTIGVAEGLKRSMDEVRPDGDDDRSFPSGHTAISYMLATMLHKEYGCRSPWISLGGYTVATATAASRMVHNRHWASDIVVGAGIGVLMTEMGYYLADLIFKERGLSDWIYADPLDRWRNPSFLSTDLAMSLPLTRYSLPGGVEVKPTVGINAGVQGAYFFNPHVGVGGSAAMSVMPIEYGGSLTAEPMNVARVMAGGYFSYPVFSQLRLGVKAVAGYAYYGDCLLDSSVRIGGCSTACMEVGVSASLLTAETFGFRLFCDYGLGGSYVAGQDGVAQYVAVGGSASIYF